MVLCKYFLSGNCRYGSNCRFEHSYSSKYNYHAPQNQNQNNAPQTSGVTDEHLLNQVRTDVHAALRGGQWILSSYAPFSQRPTLPGIPNLSPEEARLFIYEAKANNNVEQAVAFMNNLTQETRQKYEQLLQPNAVITNTLRSLYKGEVVSSPFSNTQSSGFGTTNTASSVFRSAVDNTKSIFPQNNSNTSFFAQGNQNNTNSVFAQNNQTNNTAASIFAQKANSVFSSSGDSAPSVFAQATQSIFASPTSPFNSQTPDPAKSIFSQANQTVPPNANVFQSPPQQGQVNPSSVFASASQQFFSQPTQPASPFTQPFQNQEPSNIFSTNVFNNQVDDGGIYSKMEDLSQTDLEAFNNTDFKLGFIPEVPPPQALCT